MNSLPPEPSEVISQGRHPEKVPGRIGVYERPQGINLSSILFAGLTGLVILALIALAVYVMLL